MHILIVERDEEVRGLLVMLLGGQGYTVEATCGPLEALKMVRIRVPDVVISSLIFFDMSGFELCRRLRAIPETSTKLILALTGYLTIGIEEEVEKAGFDRYLPKPFDIDVLLTLLTSAKSEL